MERQIAAMRQFNRFFTRQIGVLQEGLLNTPYSLTEARIIFELAQRGDTTAREIGAELNLDKGYLSRILTGLEKQGLLARVRSATDSRQRRLSLTKQGLGVYDTLDDRSASEIRALLEGLPGTQRQQMLGAMRSIQDILERKPDIDSAYTLRGHRPGDMGWVTHRHGLLYAQEYGWDERFEALVARITADFIDRFQPARERCWIAERYGEIVGSIFVVEADRDTAKIRLLLVEPSARGLGLGKSLVREAIEFAREAGYRRITLWTNSVLTVARHIYEAEDFMLVAEEPHDSFGIELVGQYWERDLAG